MEQGHLGYLSNADGWDVNYIVRWLDKCPWKAITQASSEFFLCTCYSVCNDTKIHF